MGACLLLVLGSITDCTWTAKVCTMAPNIQENKRKGHCCKYSCPAGPSTQDFRFLVPKTIPLMAFGTRVIQHCECHRDLEEVRRRRPVRGQRRGAQKLRGLVACQPTRRDTAPHEPRSRLGGFCKWGVLFVVSLQEKPYYLGSTLRSLMFAKFQYSHFCTPKRHGSNGSTL